MIRRPRRRKWMAVGAALVAGGAFAAILSCSEDSPPIAEIVIAVDTDVAITDSVDSIRVEVTTFGAIQFANDYRVGQGQLLIPATLGVLQGKDPATPVTLRLIAKKQDVPRMIREVTTTVPTARIVTLRMPIRWLCDQSSTAPNKCPDGQTCISGDCTSSEIPSDQLPDYSASDFDRNGTCFDVLGCMAGAVAVQPDLADCTIAKPALPDAQQQRFNVALNINEKDGICDATKSTCFVILDKSRPPPIEDGWRDVGNNRLQLPRAVCTRLTNGRIKSVVTTQTCPTKTASTPVCGSWSSVGGPASTVVDSGSTTPIQPTGNSISTLNGVSMSSPNNSCKLQLVNNFLLFCAYPGAGGGQVQFYFRPADSTSADPTSIVAGQGTNIRGPVFGSDEMFWVNASTSPGEQLAKSGYDGGGFLGVNTVVVGQGRYANRAAMDDASFYIITLTNAAMPQPLYAIPKDGSPSHSLGGSLSAANLQPALVLAEQSPAGFVYVLTNNPATTAFPGTIESFSKQGVDAGAAQVTPTVRGVIDALIEADGSAIYYAAFAPDDMRARIFKQPLLAGGAFGPSVELATSDGPLLNLAMDGTHVYFVATKDFVKRAVYRVAKDGSSGGSANEVPTVSVPQNFAINSIVVSSDTIFVAATIVSANQATLESGIYAFPKPQ